MPTQTPTTTGTAYYNEGDTYPPLVRQLLDSDGEALDLTTATAVTITIAHAPGDYYYSPYTKLVDRSACTITTAAQGIIQWLPGSGVLTPPGTYLYSFEVTFPGGVQTVPAHKYEVMVIKSRPGG